MAKHVLKLSAIIDFFCDEKRAIKRGENAVQSGHIKTFDYSSELRVMRSEVYASMKARTYHVEVFLDSEGDIEKATCTCPRGLYLCHHVAAVCLHGHYNISITDVECSWAVRKPAADEQTKSAKDMYPVRTHRSTERNLNKTELDRFQQDLNTLGSSVGFKWLLCNEPQDDGLAIPAVEDILFSLEYIRSTDKRQYLLQKMSVTSEKIKEIADVTIGQSANENWLTYRKNRLTASHFGIAIKAISRNKYPISLFRQLTESYNLDKISAIQWGRSNEQGAIEEFSHYTGLKVNATGLWLHPCGFLGCSPDGLIGETAILEVKCPYKFRKKSMSLELQVDHTYIIQISDSGEAQINYNHPYYHQIQGTLYITGRQKCYLMIWTPSQNIITEVPVDPEWVININKLKEFYINLYIEHIVDNFRE